MKQLILIVLLGVLFGCESVPKNDVGKFSDLKDYGLKGKVKTVKTQYLIKEGLYPDNCLEEIWYFNKQGNISRKLSIHHCADSTRKINPDTMYTVSSFNDEGFKTEEKYMNQSKEFTGFTTFKWTGKYTYLSEFYDTNNVLRARWTSKLDKNYRAKSAKVVQYDDLGKESYKSGWESELDENGQVKSIREWWNDYEYNYSLRYLAEDALGNVTKWEKYSIEGDIIVEKAERKIMYYP